MQELLKVIEAGINNQQTIVDLCKQLADMNTRMAEIIEAQDVRIKSLEEDVDRLKDWQLDQLT